MIGKYERNKKTVTLRDSLYIIFINIADIICNRLFEKSDYQRRIDYRDWYIVKIYFEDCAIYD